MSIGKVLCFQNPEFLNLHIDKNTFMSEVAQECVFQKYLCFPVTWEEKAIHLSLHITIEQSVNDMKGGIGFGWEFFIFLANVH